MKYPELCLPSRISCKWDKCGYDNPTKCLDIEHYNSFYTQDISYEYNSRGYRDEEWPADELKECIFVIGASYTQGTALPLHDTWGKQLERLTGRRVIMISLYSASNDWLLRMVQYIKSNIDPKYIIAHWSYLQRRESSDTSLTDEARRIEQAGFTAAEDMLHFQDTINNTPTEVINVLLSGIPNRKLLSYMPNSNFNRIEKECTILDRGRDSVHYGIKTSTNLAIQLSKLIM